IGRLRSNSVQGQQLFSQSLSRLGQHFCKRPAVGTIKKLDKILQATRLLAEVSRRSNQLLEFANTDCTDPNHTEHTRCLQLTHRNLDVRPVGVLGQKCADDDLEPAVGGPPVLWPPCAREYFVHACNLLAWRSECEPGHRMESRAFSLPKGHVQRCRRPKSRHSPH